MKKYFILMCCLMCLIVTLVACGNPEIVKNPENKKIKIVTSFYPMYIATSNIIDGVTDIELYNLTTTETGCLHDYQLTTENMMNLEDADIFIINGSGMESFIDNVAREYDDLAIIDASEGIINNSGAELNAHIWVSVSKYIEEVENICDSLVKLDEKNSEKFISNKNAYIQKLEALKEEMHSEIDKLENKNIVTFHEAFYYFAEEFNLNVVAVIEREPGTSPSAGELADIIDKIKNTNAKAIFVEPQYSRSIADTISNETGVQVYTLDPVVTGKLDNDAYINIMKSNLNNLLEALK